MNRIDRLFAMLLRISDGKLFRAEDLASEFELSERTIYRDLAALGQMGVPLLAEAGVGYQLKSGYFLPPLLLDKKEAFTAALALKLLKSSLSGSLRDSAANATKKIEAVLPKNIRKEIERELTVLDIIPPVSALPYGNQLFSDISQAIQNRTLLKIEYRAMGKSVSESREVEPVKLFLAQDTNNWYVDAYCRLRLDWRSFRLDRIVKWTPTRRPFPSRNREPADRKKDPGDDKTATLWVREADARWIRERQHWSLKEEKSGPEDSIVMVYSNFDMGPFISWLFSVSEWMAKVEPESIKDLLKQRLKIFETLLT